MSIGTAKPTSRRTRFIIDKEKAALHGISAATISQTLKIAVDGETVDLLHQPAEKEDVNIRLELPRSAKTTPEELLAPARALRRCQRPARARRFRLAAGAVARVGEGRARHRRKKPLSQEPDARDLCHRRCGRRGGKPGLCHLQDERGARETRHRASSAAAARS